MFYPAFSPILKASDRLLDGLHLRDIMSNIPSSCCSFSGGLNLTLPHRVHSQIKSGNDANIPSTLRSGLAQPTRYDPRNAPDTPGLTLRERERDREGGGREWKDG